MIQKKIPSTRNLHPKNMQMMPLYRKTSHTVRNNSCSDILSKLREEIEKED
jgi:hypothetical protein